MIIISYIKLFNCNNAYLMEWKFTKLSQFHRHLHFHLYLSREDSLIDETQRWE